VCGDKIAGVPNRRFFVKFRGQNAHPNRVEKPAQRMRNALSPVGQCNRRRDRRRYPAGFSWSFAGGTPNPTGLKIHPNPLKTGVAEKAKIW